MPLLPRLCDHLGGRQANALWLGAANPLVLLVLVSGAHNDQLMAGLLARGTLFVLDHAHLRGFTLVATAAAVKEPAVVAGADLGWLSALGTNSWVETWLPIPTATGKLLGCLTPPGTQAGVLAAARTTGWVVLAGLWWRSREGGPAAIRGAALALLVTALFNALAFAGYRAVQAS